jgi:ABC-type Fe3+/spermidine/putrescine transport system ATPase subunit
MATAQVGSFSLRARLRDDSSVGQQVSLFVRPERVAIGAADSTPGRNRVEGRVRRVSFLGSIVRYQVEIATSVPVTVDIQNAGRKAHAIDETIALSWDVEDSLVLVN